MRTSKALGLAAIVLALAPSGCSSSAGVDGGPATDAPGAADAPSADAPPCDGMVCDGVCTDTTRDLTHCGSCTNDCGSDPNGTTECVSSACQLTCNSGYRDVAGTCVGLAPPRPVAPISTTTAASRQPAFDWRLAPGTDGARLEVCADRACTKVITTVDVMRNTSTVPEDLPPGVVYWRLFGRSGTEMGPTPSPTWELFIGAMSSPVDTTWGTVPDLDGDGYAEVIVGAGNHTASAGRVEIYAGGPGRLGSTPAAALDGPEPGGHFGFAVASAGDVDGDGFADLVVGAYAVASEGRVYVYRGGSLALSAPATVLASPAGPGGNFGGAVASAGDVDRDGYADLIVGAGGAGRAYLYRGGPDGVSTTPSITLGEGIATFGSAVAGVGDVDGDEHADVLVGSYGEISNIGRAYLYFGNRDGIPSTPSLALAGLDGVNSRYGISVAGAGDIDGDGYSDFLIGASGVSSFVGAAYVYRGGRRPLSVTPITLGGRNGPNGQFGRALAGVGDLDADGYNDILVGAYEVSLEEGRVYAYRGGPAGIGTIPAYRWVGPDGAGSRFGVALAGLGDVDGDGYADLAIGSPGTASLAGRAYVYYSSATGPASTADATLSHPEGGYYGGAIAGRN